MQAQRQSELSCSREDPSCLRGRERDVFAEGIDGIGEPPASYFRQHLIAERSDVVIWPTRKLRWHSVRAEERRHDRDAEIASDLASDAQHLELGVEVQAVAGFDLECRHAFAHERKRALARLREQARFGCSARRADRRQNPASAACDLLVRRAALARCKLVASIACVDQVRVRVDQTRRDPNAARIDLLNGRPLECRELVLATDPRDAPVTQSNRTVRNAANTYVAIQRRKIGADPKSIPCGRLHMSIPKFDSRACTTRETNTTHNTIRPSALYFLHVDAIALSVYDCMAACGMAAQRRDLRGSSRRYRRRCNGRCRDDRSSRKRRRYSGHAERAQPRVSACDGRSRGAAGKIDGFVLELARGDVSTRIAHYAGGFECDRCASLCRHVARGVYGRLRVSLFAQPGGWHALRRADRHVPVVDRCSSDRRHRTHTPSHALPDERLRRAADASTANVHDGHGSILVAAR